MLNELSGRSPLGTACAELDLVKPGIPTVNMTRDTLAAFCTILFESIVVFSPA
jgi:hypothetical protein